METCGRDLRVVKNSYDTYIPQVISNKVDCERRVCKNYRVLVQAILFFCCWIQKFQQHWYADFLYQVNFSIAATMSLIKVPPMYHNSCCKKLCKSFSQFSNSCPLAMTLSVSIAYSYSPSLTISSTETVARASFCWNYLVLPTSSRDLGVWHCFLLSFYDVFI